MIPFPVLQLSQQPELAMLYIVHDNGVKECNTRRSGDNPQQKSVRGKQQAAPVDGETTDSGLDTERERTELPKKERSHKSKGRYFSATPKHVTTIRECAWLRDHGLSFNQRTYVL